MEQKAPVSEKGPRDRGCAVRELYLWFQLTQPAALGLKSQWKNDPFSVTFVLVLLKFLLEKKIKHLDAFMERVIMVTTVGGGGLLLFP